MESLPRLTRLDVGSGEVPTGDVNVDRFLYVQAKDRTSIRTKADVIADAHFLPFRERSFDEVYSSHLIEHVWNPAGFLRECERIARKRVVIKCPSRWAKGHRRNQFHLWSMTRKWFARMGYSSTADFRLLRIYPIPFGAILPSEITAVKYMDKKAQPGH